MISQINGGSVCRPGNPGDTMYVMLLATSPPQVDVTKMHYKYALI